MVARGFSFPSKIILFNVGSQLHLDFSLRTLPTKFRMCFIMVAKLRRVKKKQDNQDQLIFLFNVRTKAITRFYLCFII